MIKELLRVCRGRKVCIQMHDVPDADAIASAYGLQYILKTFDIESTIVHHEPINRFTLERLVSIFHIDTVDIDEGFTCDVLILVDCQKNESNVRCAGNNVLCCIDHHPVTKEVDYELCDFQLTGACSVLIAQYFVELNLKIPDDVATCLLYGLKMDTLNFSRNVTSLDIDIFKFLHLYANEQIMNLLETDNLLLSDLQAYGSAIKNISVVSDIAMSYVPFDCPDSLIAILAEFILDVIDINIVLVFSVRDNGVKLSVRSVIKDVPAGKLVQKAVQDIGSGGGHDMFAGGFVPRDVFEVYDETNIVNLLKPRFMLAVSDMIQIAADKS